jgi:hypothetical protein
MAFLVGHNWDAHRIVALRVAARKPAAQGRVVILRLYGTAKAVP